MWGETGSVTTATGLPPVDEGLGEVAEPVPAAAMVATAEREPEVLTDDKPPVEVEELPAIATQAEVEKETGRRSGGRATRLAPILLAGALLAALVLLGISQMSLRDKNSLNSARTSALAASRSYSVELASYDYHHLDQDFGKVLNDSTPAFKQTFSRSSAALKTILTRYNATAKADVIAAGLVSGSTNRAVALVFLNQTVTNSTQKSGQPTTTQSRVEMTLLHQHGRWLIDQVSLF
jgi:Mce-associated membrane protein